MKTVRKVLALAGASALAVAAAPAFAAVTINWSPQTTDTGSISDFDTAAQTFASVFANTLKFNFDAASLYGSGYFHNHGAGTGFTISAIVNGTNQQIFASGPLGGADQALQSFGTISFAGGNVTGISLQSDSFIGNAFHGFASRQTFTLDSTAAAVPEPATWAMMILGFGLVAMAMRKRQSTTVRYAF